MEEFLASVNIGGARSVHIAPLARQTIVDAEADHLGCDGYFIFECNDSLDSGRGITILGKVTSLEAAFRMIEIFKPVFLPNVSDTDRAALA